MSEPNDMVRFDTSSHQVLKDSVRICALFTPEASSAVVVVCTIAHFAAKLLDYNSALFAHRYVGYAICS